MRLVVVYPPGGGIDLLARVMGRRFTASWGQQIVVDNRPGAGTTIGAATAAKAPADGYTLLMTDVSYAITPSLHATLPYDPHKSFDPISLVNLVTDVLVVHPSLPATTVKELIVHAAGHAGPDKVLVSMLSGILQLSAGVSEEDGIRRALQGGFYRTRRRLFEGNLLVRPSALQ